MAGKRTSGIGFTLFVVVVVLIAVAVVMNTRQMNSFGEGSAGGGTALPIKGYLAPDFTLKSFEGQSVTLSLERGKPVFLNFWASWCPPCQAETPDLVEMHKKYGDKIAFYGINLTHEDDRQKALDFIRNYKIDYPVLSDVEGKVADLYRVQAIPTSVFIGSDGKIAELVQGMLTKQDMDRLFQQLESAK
ncbi:MAG: TlpA disulfide reductase family protein [Kyrpidia sp.]|nr:TlpA disulfide reductase family protein [Kyrpidia sp.]